MDYPKVHVDYLDLEELACKITGLDYDGIDADTEIIEEKLYDELNIDLYSFCEIVSRLLPLIDVGKSLLTEKSYKGFSNQKGVWLVKTEV